MANLLLPQHLLQSTVRLLHLDAVLRWKKLPSFEEVPPVNYEEIPYQEIDSQKWEEVCIVSWLWPKLKPARYNAFFSPMPLEQLARFQKSLKKECATAGRKYVWIDWCCAPQYSAEPLVEVARSKLFFMQAASLLIIPDYQPATPGGLLMEALSSANQSLQRITGKLTPLEDIEAPRPPARPRPSSARPVSRAVSGDMRPAELSRQRSRSETSLRVPDGELRIPAPPSAPSSGQQRTGPRTLRVNEAILASAAASNSTGSVATQVQAPAADLLTSAAPPTPDELAGMQNEMQAAMQYYDNVQNGEDARDSTEGQKHGVGREASNAAPRPGAPSMPTSSALNLPEGDSMSSPAPTAKQQDPAATVAGAGVTLGQDMASNVQVEIAAAQRADSSGVPSSADALFNLFPSTMGSGTFQNAAASPTPPRLPTPELLQSAEPGKFQPMQYRPRVQQSRASWSSGMPTAGQSLVDSSRPASTTAAVHKSLGELREAVVHSKPGNVDAPEEEAPDWVMTVKPQDLSSGAEIVLPS